MRRELAAAVWMLLAVACQKPAPAAQATKADAMNSPSPWDVPAASIESSYSVTVKSAGPPPFDKTRRFPFDITRVYRNQRQLEHAPWHADGGDWLFFDARTPGGASFTVGLAAEQPRPPAYANGSNAILVVPNREVGQKFVKEFARAFGVAGPSGGGPGAMPVWIRSAILKNEAKRSRKGDFTEGGGDWVAMQWLVNNGMDDNVVVRFNYSLHQRRGEFAPDDDDLVGLVDTFNRDLGTSQKAE